jgi:uncharacterized Zn finger protein (UPF0148 family)
MTQMIGYPCPDCDHGLCHTSGYTHVCPECGGTAVMWQTKPPRSWPAEPPEPVDEPPEVIRPSESRPDHA